jgi:hypothetical protein
MPAIARAARRRVTAGQPPAPRLEAVAVRACRECGCTDDDCGVCIERTGEPCFWVAADFCSACAQSPAAR